MKAALQIHASGIGQPAPERWMRRGVSWGVAAQAHR